jgi:hypothetical protein
MLMHQLQRLSIHPNWCVIDQRTASLEQFTLKRQAQLCTLFADHLAAFPLSSILSIGCRAVDGLIILALVTKLVGPWPRRGRVSPLTILHRELADFGVKFFDLVVLILGLFDLV